MEDIRRDLIKAGVSPEKAEELVRKHFGREQGTARIGRLMPTQTMFTMMSSMITMFIPMMIIIPFIRVLFSSFIGTPTQVSRGDKELREEAKKNIIRIAKEAYEEHYNELVERISERGYSKPRVRRALDELVETLKVG